MNKPWSKATWGGICLLGLHVRIHYYRQSVQELKRHLEGGPEREAKKEWSLPPRACSFSFLIQPRTLDKGWSYPQWAESSQINNKVL